MRSHRAFAGGALLLVALLAGSCQCQKDTDGVPAGANPLPLDQERLDHLQCAPDCADWFRTSVADSGTLVVRVTPRGTSTAARFHLELYREDMTPLDSAIGQPGKPARVAAHVRPGSYLSLVRVDSGRLDYEIVPRLRRDQARPPPPSPPPPPPPAYRTVEARVVEMERAGSEQRVVLDQGEQAGIRSGQRGRLVDGGRTLAEIEVIAVFPTGSRAKIVGSMSGGVSRTTRAEIRVRVK